MTLVVFQSLKKSKDRMFHSQLWLLSLITLLPAVALHASQTLKIGDRSLKTAIFHSPPIILRPGSVANKIYFNIPFPKGHIALKSFDAEVVDENGISVPLHETYLHHWVVERFYSDKEHKIPGELSSVDVNLKKFILARNAGICKRTLGQYFGLGSETRRTSTWVPDPYGIEVGNLKDIPKGYKEMWLLNVHAIDTRGVEDRVGCTECRCNLYNVTKDEHGRPLRKDYTGGLYCCYDETQCRVREGFGGIIRKLYLKYTVTWVDWHDSIIPVKIYIFDVTDTGEVMDGPYEGIAANLSCKVEYEVKACGLEGKANGKCLDTKKARLVIPNGGDIIYGVAHQHSGGVGSSLYGQDGRVLCTSIPVYGDGREAGNEAGYIIGMSTCYPEAGSVRVADGEVLTLESNYSRTQMHTGVMGLFYILVAEPQPQPKTLHDHSFPISRGFELLKYTWACVLAGAILAVIIGVSYCWVSYCRKHDGDEGYQTLVNN
ncbi:uncharacterized protein LOC103720742 isoform X2 [Phoenix dactylifera]|uniref:Uncharacterized protein LOC103720742 isoform X2 n=1 Tax=Phoenix dactylifera TaxID=42345 RepID=A0A8B7CY32_PHODC|nr:uncharacterized protein LOC103720742 isoform X2 [Phoenix dactylifera]